MLVWGVLEQKQHRVGKPLGEMRCFRSPHFQLITMKDYFIVPEEVPFCLPASGGQLGDKLC